MSAYNGPPQARPAGLGGMDLTQGNVARVLFIFSLPVILQMSIQPLFSVMDRIFISQISAEAFAAVTNASTLQMFIILLAAGLANGVTSYISRLVGAGDYAEADNAAQHAIILMIVASALVMAIFLPLEEYFFRGLGVSEELMPYAKEYIRVILVGNITIMFTLIGANILRGEGNSNTPFVIALVTVLINLVLDPILMFGPEDEIFGMRLGWLGLSVRGAAWATIISRVVGCLMLIGYLMLGKTVWTFSLKNFHWHPHHFVEILRVGLPMLMVNLISWLASLVFLKVLNPFDGAIVAFGMGIQMDALAVLPMIGLMLGVISMVGQNYGAGKIERAESSALVGGVFAALFSGLMGIIFFMFPDFWVGLFNRANDPVVQELGKSFIYIVAFTYILVSQVFVLGGAFQGLGMGLPPLIITVTRFLLVAVPITVILPRYIGPVGAWIGIAGSHCVGGIMAIIWLILEFRKRRGMSECHDR